YVLYAVDRDNAMPPQNRRGDAATSAAIPFDNKVPSAPGSLTATRVDGSTVALTWDNKAKDEDGTIASYRIYRDGTSLSDAIGSDAQRRVDAEDRARQAEEAIARDLRNLASPTPSQPQAVDRAGGRDLVFKTVDPVGPNAGQNTANVERVRYCLDSAGRLWRMQ